MSDCYFDQCINAIEREREREREREERERERERETLLETLFLAIKLCTDFTTDVISINTMCAVSLANQCTLFLCFQCFVHFHCVWIHTNIEINLLNSFI